MFSVIFFLEFLSVEYEFYYNKTLINNSISTYYNRITYSLSLKYENMNNKFLSLLFYAGIGKMVICYTRHKYI